MTLKRLLEMCATGLWLAIGVIVPRACEAITLNQPGYIANLLVNLPPEVPDDLELGPAGNLYFACGIPGIQKVTPVGVVSTWSTAPALDLTLTSGGDGYGAGRANCDCILNIQSNGSYSTLHQDSHEWTFVALTPDGTLYATIMAGEGQGLYQIDRTTGQPSLIVAGGPGPAGDGIYFGMTSGSDGKLYVLGNLDGTTTGNRLFRLDGSQLVAVASPPHAGVRLALGPSGKFYVTTAFDYGSGFPVGEVWVVDPVSGETSLLVTSGSYPGLPHPTFGAVGYDAGSGTLYIAESRQIWAIKKDPTPAMPESWGAVKARYRGGAR
jgi:hypothetical protein